MLIDGFPLSRFALMFWYFLNGGGLSSKIIYVGEDLMTDPQPMSSEALKCLQLEGG